MVPSGGAAFDGTDNADIIVGISRNDTINGKKGDDIICDRGGNDQLFGGDDNDIP